MPGQCLDTVGDVGQDYDTMKIVVINLRDFEVEMCQLQGIIGCGDGNWETDDEECDDDNLVDGDGCDRSCEVEDYYRCLQEDDWAGGATISLCTQDWCGNELHTSVYATVQYSPTDEDCDDGNFVADDGCTNCTIDNYYECQTRTGNAAADYTTDCHIGCGDEFQLSAVALYDTTGRARVATGDTHTEECDDDNATDDDGCTDCVTDLGWTCEPFNTCVESCGNGVLDPQSVDAGSAYTTTDPVEVCDDGNNPT
jgi:cysteine-rich repeat protein